VLPLPIRHILLLLLFLPLKKDGSFTWVLETSVGLLNSKLNMPRVIVTNRGTALVNFVAKVLPETAALLCHFHIERNVRVKCITNR